MLTKNDLQQIKTAVDDSLHPIKEDVSDLKKDVSSLKINILTLRSDFLTLKTDVSSIKQNVSTLKTDVSVLKKDVSGLKQDMGTVKTKLDELYDFSVESIGNILDWTNKIHTSIVQKKLPERVERLEKHSGLPQFAD